MFKKLLLTSALLVTFASAQAQSSQPFGFTGTVTPTPCNVTLTGGTVNLGTLSIATVKGYNVQNNSYTVPLQDIPIAIICGAATRVQVSLVDNKLGKNFPVDVNDSIRFGMTDGTTGTAAVGAYELFFATTTTIDSVAVGTYLHAANGATTWSKNSATTTNTFLNPFLAPGFATGFAKAAAATVPESITTLAGTLRIKIYFSKALVDAATTNFVPNGSGTLTLAYL